MRDSGSVIALVAVGLVATAALVGLFVGRSVAASYGRGVHVVRGRAAQLYNAIYLILAAVGAIGILSLG